MAKSSFEAIRHYRESLNELEGKFGALRGGRPAKQTLRDAILTVLCARDELEQVLHDRYQAPSSLPPLMLEQIDQLDELLKQRSGAIAKYLDLEKWRQLYKVTDTERWWWYCVHPLDRFDWLWKLVTVACIVVFLSLFLDATPRFWAGGPSVWGAIAIVGPALLTWSLGKDLSEGLSRVRGKLDGALEKTKLPIPKPYRREIALLVALVLTGAAYCKSQDLKNWIAEHYYHQAEQQLDHGKDSESKTLATAEANLKRAIAFNPDHPDAHFQLGWLYERRQELDTARTEYKLATQNGSLLARVRLARLYLLDEKENSANAAVIILLQEGRSAVEQFPDKEIQKSWYTALGWARLQQKRYEDAKEELNRANQLHKELKRTIPGYLDNPQQKPPTTFYCVMAEVLEKLNNRQQAKEQWEQCGDWSNPRDLDEDWWLTKVKQRLKY